MILDGKQIAEKVYEQLPRTSRTLGILVGEVTPVIESFVRIKERAATRLGVTLVRRELAVGASTEDAREAVRVLASETDGVIVQLPLPSAIDTDAVLAAIPSEKDVDGISPFPKVRPPVAEAVREILESTGTQVHDVVAVVVGSGRLVGKPSSELLRDMGARVHLLTKGDSFEILKEADIVVLGAGEQGIVQPEQLKRGVVLIDAGTSDLPPDISGSGRKIAGDADPRCIEVASIFTPVPGGVGPIAVAMIFKNLYDLTK